MTNKTSLLSEQKGEIPPALRILLKQVSGDEALRNNYFSFIEANAAKFS